MKAGQSKTNYFKRLIISVNNCKFCHKMCNRNKVLLNNNGKKNTASQYFLQDSVLEIQGGRL